MKNNKPLKIYPLLFTFLALLLPTDPAIASSKDSALSVGIGLNNVAIDDKNFTKNNLSQSYHIGYRFSETLGGELGFIDFGSVTLGGSGVFKDNIPSELAASYISIMRYFVINEQVDLYGKIGLLYSSVSFSSFMGFEEEIADQSIFFGVGGKYAYSSGFNITTELGFYQIESEYGAVRAFGDTIEVDATITSVGIGFEWVF